MDTYIRMKEFSDTMNEERKRKMYKMNELETKRVLDI